MSDAMTTPKRRTERRSDASPNALRKRRQKAWRERRKAVFEATLKMLEATPDDALIVIQGRE